MTGWQDGRGYRYVLKTCLHEANDIHTEVKWKFYSSTTFRENDVITPYINPHEQCDCDEVPHPKKFRLRMRTMCPHEFNPKVGLYISCEPSALIKCEVVSLLGPQLAVRSMRYTAHTNHIGWQYVTTILWHEFDLEDEDDYAASADESMEQFNYVLHLKLYLDKEPKVPALPAPEHSLSSHLSHLLTDSIYSDVALSSQEGVIFKAHKVILAQRSSVFLANLKHNEDNVITTPLKEDTLSQMLTYIYTDTTPEPSVVTGDLLMAADYYQLSGLKTICVSALSSHLTADNAVAALELAVKFKCSEMIQFTVYYIKTNLELVAETKDYKNITSVDVMKVLFENGMKL